MNSDLHITLLEADKPVWYKEDVPYGGEGVDVQDSIRRACLVRKDLAKEFRRYFVLDDRVQDAFYWGEVADVYPGDVAIERPIFIRFSYCGNLASTWTVAGIPVPTDDEKRKIISFLYDHGFIWVDGDVLKAAKYDGVYDYFKTADDGSPLTWWERFFEHE